MPRQRASRCRWGSWECVRKPQVDKHPEHGASAAQSGPTCGPMPPPAGGPPGEEPAAAVPHHPGAALVGRQGHPAVWPLAPRQPGRPGGAALQAPQGNAVRTKAALGSLFEQMVTVCPCPALPAAGVGPSVPHPHGARGRRVPLRVGGSQGEPPQPAGRAAGSEQPLPAVTACGACSVAR